MARTARTNRAGFTLLELLCVLAAIIVLGAILVPTLSGMRADTRTKAGADVVQSYISKARNKAIEDGVPYRLAIHMDGKRVRLSPDAFETMGEMPAVTEDDDLTSGAPISEDDLPEGVTAVLVSEDEFQSQDQSGWKRVATFLPDGTCREDAVVIRIEEKDVSPVLLFLRGVTGTVSASRGGGGSP